MDPAPTIDRSLVNRAAAGDRRAQDDLFRSCLGSIQELVRRRLGLALRSRMETQDLAQTALAEAFRDLDGFHWRGEGSFERWLHRVVENKIRQKAIYYRRQKRDIFREVPVSERTRSRESEALGVEPIEARTPSLILGLRQDVQRVEAALAKLSPLHAEVIRLARLEKLPYRTIGEQLGGRSEDAVRKLLHRALVKLSRLAGETCEEEPQIS